MCCSVVGERSGDGHGGKRPPAGSSASTATSLSSTDADSVSVVVVVVTEDRISLFDVVHGVQRHRWLSFHLLSFVGWIRWVNLLVVLIAAKSYSTTRTSETLTHYSAKAFIVSAILNNIKLVPWPLMGELLHLAQRRGTGRGHSPARPFLAVLNVTVHASVPITV